MTSPRTDTKNSLLDAAETLFATHGYAGASLRAITARAGANLAAAHYHFGSKDALLRAVLRRRLEPINRERLARLAAIERRPPAAQRLHDLVAAFVVPVLAFGRELPDGGRPFVELCGRAMTAPERTLRAILVAEIGEVVERFSQALGAALPHLPEDELRWRVHFMVGAMSHTMAGARMMAAVSRGRCDAGDVRSIVARLVTFLVAGLEAPATP